MVSMPRAIEITLEFCATNEPSPPNKIPYETNKTVNPETNSIEPSNTLLFVFVSLIPVA